MSDEVRLPTESTFGGWYAVHSAEVSGLGERWVAVDPDSGAIVHSAIDQCRFDDETERWMGEHGRGLWAFHTLNLVGYG